MTNEQYLKNLTSPKGMVDVILDTDAYNEIDDQFAIAYMLKSTDKLNVKGICAAPFGRMTEYPFLNFRAENTKDGMLKSYNEIFKILDLMQKNEFKNKVFMGSEEFLVDEKTPRESEAAEFIATLADSYSPEKPLYIVAIGAITNVASAILKNKNIAQNCVVIWLGGHAQHIENPVVEFNMYQDIAAARVVFKSGVPLVQLPCSGVVSSLRTTKPELEYWLKGKNKLCDYLIENTIEEAERETPGKPIKAGTPWSRVIWDVAAVAWLLNEAKTDDYALMKGEVLKCPVPEYNFSYSYEQNNHYFKYINFISRDNIFNDLFKKLGE